MGRLFVCREVPQADAGGNVGRTGKWGAGSESSERGGHSVHGPSRRACEIRRCGGPDPEGFSERSIFASN